MSRQGRLQKEVPGADNARSKAPSNEAAAVPRGSNRRSHHRVYLRTDVTLCDPRGRSHAGLLGNLGDGGIFIHAPSPFPSGTRLRAFFDLSSAGEGGPVQAEGRVAWVRLQGERRLPGFAIRFTGIEPADRNRIRKLLEERAAASRRLWLR